MNEQKKTPVNSLQDVALRLPQLYSESSAKAYASAFNRVEKLTGQRLAHLPADEAAWADLSRKIVWVSAVSPPPSGRNSPAPSNGTRISAACAATRAACTPHS